MSKFNRAFLPHGGLPKKKMASDYQTYITNSEKLPSK